MKKIHHSLALLTALLPLAAAAQPAQQDLKQAVQAAQDAPNALKKLDPPCPGCAAKAKKKDKRSPIPLFNQKAGIEVEMTGPFPRVAGTGTISLQGKDGPETVQASFEPRGVMRAAACSGLPPFKIVLKKGKKGTIFKHSDRDLKFVTHCKEPIQAKTVEGILQEYTVYRLLEAAGLSGYLVQLANVTYKNAKTGFTTKAPGFFIENSKDAFTRNLIEDPERAKAQNVAEYRLAETFAMNNDAHLPPGNEVEGHNTRVMKDQRAPAGVILPYDFDIADMVNQSVYGGGGMDRNSMDRDQEKIQVALKLQPDAGRAVLQKVVDRADRMHATVDESPLNAESKKFFHERVDHFIAAARTALAPKE